VSVSPGSITLAPGTSASFRCEVAGAEDTACTWSVAEGAAGGAITAAGVYTAPAAAGTYHIVASSRASPDAIRATAVTVAASAETAAVASAAVAANVWANVTPSNANLTQALSCSNYGVNAVQADPARPTDLYAHFYCQGIWKSTDYGQTWTGPIDTGANGATARDCAGGIAVAKGASGGPAIVYRSCIRGAGTGFWRSTDGGVSWTRFSVTPGGARQDFYPPAVDPYDSNHLLMAGHEMNLLVESADGGQTWRSAPMNAGMSTHGGTAGVFFVDTGSAATTRTTWLWIAQQSGGTYGTWRTATSGAGWTRVDKNEHPHGASQIYQAGGGVIYMAGAYSALGWGVLRSADYGLTWKHVGGTSNETAVWGTPGNVYAGFGWAHGLGTQDSPNLESAPAPGTGTWTTASAPSGLLEGPASVAVTTSPSGRVFVGAMWQSGLWRYVEGTGGTPTPPPAAVAITVSPAAASLPAGATLQLTASVTGSSDTAATWSVQEGSAGGTVSGSGLYTAPSAAGTYHVVARSHADATTSAAATLTVTAATGAGGLPALHVSGSSLVDPHGNRVILRGVSSQGMAMVYGDKSNPGTYLPMTPAQYVNRAVQTDATGNRWYSTAVRLIFERFPCVNPGRLYTVENQPWAMPDTIAFSPWQPSITYTEGSVFTSGGNRYRAVKKLWRGDRGQPWNPSPYQVGEVVVNPQGNVYKCVSSTGSGAPAGDWGAYPQGTGSAIPENQGNLQYVWQYVGPYGKAGTTPPSSLSPVTDNQQKWLIDNLVQWQLMSTDYTPAQALANFQDWKAKVMDPAIQAAVSAGLYVVVTDFDFGPAQHPLRHARMLDFWTRMARSQWANHPQVIFELWNESEDIGSYAGGPGSWAQQKPVIQETIDAVRAAGARNVIIVPTPFYSAWIGEATASPLTGGDIAYALHFYRSQWEAYPSNRDQANQGLASGQAVIVTEWGDDTNPTDPNATWVTTTTAPPALKQLLEPSEGAAHPAAGWFAWALTQNWFPDLFQDNALTQPTAFGVATRQWLSAKRTDSQPAP
jgi:hypothetical protein